MKKGQSKKKPGRMVKGFGYLQWVEQHAKRQYGASVQDEEKGLGEMDGRMTTEMTVVVRALILIVGRRMFVVRLFLPVKTGVVIPFYPETVP